MYQEFETRHEVTTPSGLSAPAPLLRERNGEPPTPGDVIPFLVGTTVSVVEQELVLQTLAHCDGNRTHAARILGLSVRTLRNKIRLYLADGINVPAHS